MYYQHTNIGITIISIQEVEDKTWSIVEKIYF